jgi:hypothetical protein
MLDSCRFFFALRGEKEPTKEEKYHAAAGYDRFLVILFDWKLT